YGFVEVNERKMHYYLQKNAEMAEILLAENYVRECNVLVSNMYIDNKGGFNKAQIEGIGKMIDKMQILKAKYKTNTIVIFTNDLTFFYYQSRGDFKKALDIAKEGLEENINLNNDEILGVFQSKMNIGTCYLNLKNYNEATTWFKEAISLPTPGTRYWFWATSLYYLNLIFRKQFNELFSLTINVISNKNLIKYSYFQEQWAIREAFLHFMIRAGKIDISDEEREALKPFIFSKFINSVPFHSKDKSGQNITILVLQILFLLSDRKYDKIIDRIDALTQYSYRYLRNDETFRSNCFIKMLILMSNASFNPIRTRTYTMELSKKLKKSHLNTDEKSTQVEIIPYDYLWEVILEVLERNK
ncbi:MAG: tetratricopeptide repeat protein, partial [Saprospiraceae bacterium]